MTEPDPVTPAPVAAPKPLPAPEGTGFSRPTPSDVAAAARRVPTAPAGGALAYQGSTGGPSLVMPGYDDPAIYDDQMDAVVAKVLSAFRLSATAEELAALLRNKPSVPRDLDRAMPVDLSDVLDMYELPDSIRYRLRERFWLQCMCARDWQHSASTSHRRHSQESRNAQGHVSRGSRRLDVPPQSLPTENCCAATFGAWLASRRFCSGCGTCWVMALRSVTRPTPLMAWQTSN